MKCPKCGYNSFEYYDACKKCSTDLSGHKKNFSLTPLILPLEARYALTAVTGESADSLDESGDTVAPQEELFSFDLPEEAGVAEAAPADNLFAFDDTAPFFGGGDIPVPASVQDALADLTGNPPAGATDSPFGFIAAGSGNDAGADGFDFSWDTTPSDGADALVPKSGTAPSSEGLDDFDALFGDAPEDNRK